MSAEEELCRSIQELTKQLARVRLELQKMRVEGVPIIPIDAKHQQMRAWAGRMIKPKTSKKSGKEKV